MLFRSDFAFKLISGSLAVLYLIFVFIGPSQGWILLVSIAGVAIMLIVMLLLLFSKKFLQMFSFVSRFPVLSKLYSVMTKMQENSGVIVRKTPHIIILLLLGWAARSMAWFFVAKSLGIVVHTPAPFPEFVFYFFLQPLLTMLEFIPSPTIAGLGLSEGGATLVFSLFGVPPAVATSFALITRFKTTLIHLPAIPEALGILGKKSLYEDLH